MTLRLTGRPNSCAVSVLAMPPETLRTLAADLIAELRHLDRRIAKAASDIQTAPPKVRGRGRSIDSAAASFATYTGTAPINLSSGDVVRQGLSCAGDRQFNLFPCHGPYPDAAKHPGQGLLPTQRSQGKGITKKRCDASNDDYPTSSTDNSATTHTGWGQAREDTRGRLYRPARPAQTPHTDASDKSLPHLPKATIQPNTYRAHLTQRGAVMRHVRTHRRRPGPSIGRQGARQARGDSRSGRSGAARGTWVAGRPVIEFQRHLGMSPMAYVREVRVRSAHRDLRSADPAHTTVAAIAHRWGFTHLGRFAAAHKKKFGNTPVQALHAAR